MFRFKPGSGHRILPIAGATSGFLQAILLFWFLSIPQAQSYIPLRIVHSPELYDWTPEDTPRWYHVDSPTAPGSDYFREAVGTIGTHDTPQFEAFLLLMSWTREQALPIDSKKSITGNPIVVHQSMRAGIPAQCGNFATVYASVTSSLGTGPNRLWHFVGSDGWSGDGHVANEVWIADLQKWVMVDPMNNGYLLVDGVPASVLEVRQALLSGQRDRLVLRMGQGFYSPTSEGMFRLYESTMAVISLPAHNNPLTSDLGRTDYLRIIENWGVPEPAAELVGKGIALLTGEARQVMLIDDLSGERAHSMPYREAKLCFWLLIANSFALIGFGSAAIVLLVRCQAAKDAGTVIAQSSMIDA